MSKALTVKTSVGLNADGDVLVIAETTYEKHHYQLNVLRDEPEAHVFVDNKDVMKLTGSNGLKAELNIEHKKLIESIGVEKIWYVVLLLKTELLRKMASENGS